MRIAASTAALYPVLVPNARGPAASNANDVAPSAVSTIDPAAHQRSADTRRETLPVVDVVQASANVEGVDVDALIRPFNGVFNRTSVEGNTGGAAQSVIQSPAQRAASAYAEVATQEHRDELVTLLGIDVFA